MTQENKELLLKDLCARLPYGVYVQVVDRVGYTHTWEIKPEIIEKMGWSFKSVKPYLRPMSSMTVEESGEYYNIETKNLFSWEISSKQMDWLNAHHFDYRGLIEKGLAIEVTEDNNPYKD